MLDLALEVFTDQKDEKVMDILQLPLHPDAIGDISRPKVLFNVHTYFNFL